MPTSEASSRVVPTHLSLRRLWTIYRRAATAQGAGATRRDLVLAQVAFYSGARGVIKVLDHMIEEGDTVGALRAIRRLARQAQSLQRGRRQTIQ